MSACNFECLLQFVNNQLDLDRQLEVYNHLDRCDICRDTVYQISRDLDKFLFAPSVQSITPSGARQERQGLGVQNC